ncbi:MAG: pro-sigmaK processing inhibitor BofA family protein [Clostridiales bacterium]|nr:pro-sigmaK processing inhibitor BofA family protein [Clostridiales bacterium]
MDFSFGVTEYMIIFLCIAAGCLFFSRLLKKIILCAARGALGLGTIYILNIILESSGLVLGVNLFNGVIIGLLGLPAFIGLYIIKLFAL